jgi:hypothetical protein
VTVNLAYKDVTCSNCGKEYVCTPHNDYYHPPEIGPDEYTDENGLCWDCLLAQKGMKPQPEPDYIGGDSEPR